jgi:Putative peptidoglycan binding domain/Salmonella virulence plasmid 28.1kDa A protein
MSNGDRELRVGAFGEGVSSVHSRLAALGYEAPASEVEREFFGPGTRQAVQAYQDANGLAPTGEVDQPTHAAIEASLTSPAPATPRNGPTTSSEHEGAAPTEPRALEAEPMRGVGDGHIDGAASVYTVEGTVASPDRAGVGRLRVEIVDRNVGGDVTLVDAVTDEVGHYEARFAPTGRRDRAKEQLDLQARAYTGDTLLGASDTRYNATDHETLNVLLPADSPVLPSEHETLTAALAPHLDGRLADLKETAQEPDITYLANKTGWDARAVALAALSDQFSQHRPDGTDGEGIHPAFYYALFRAGLPADPDTLYQADVQTVGSIWRQGLEQGLIPRSLAEELPRAEQAFASLSAARGLDAKALTGTSSLRDMLSLALGDDAQRQRQFSDIYTRERGDTAKFWESVRQSFGDETANRLQLDGQLGYLTLNNAPLIGRLNETEGHAPLSSTLDLARRGYYRADKWSELADGAVPEQIPGETPEEKRANYAELLATQVRLSFPTAVVAEMVGSGELPLTDVAEVRDGVHTFLSEHQGKFELGMQPIEQYVVRNNLGDQIAEPVKDQIKRLQRVYQITTADQAMTTLLKNNLDSAYQIIRYDEEEFVQGFKDDLGGEEQARLTYAKSRLVHNAVLNIASSYLTARNAPALGADTAAQIVSPAANGGAPAAANASDVVAYPTLEGLFGSMDFCACEHCRSILSPAAYLVDLLLFIDRPLNDKENAQAVLLERRPDIAHLPLTCENTNTPLPYIDVVN